VWALGAFLVSATLLYARMDAAIVQLQGGQAEIVKGVGDMRDDLRKLVTENISQREFDAWLKLLKAMNPSLSLPEAPR
jgi:truncated hemoglobin YjbI